MACVPWDMIGKAAIITEEIPLGRPDRENFSERTA